MQLPRTSKIWGLHFQFNFVLNCFLGGLLLALETLRHHVYGKRQTLVCTTWPSSPFTCRFLFIISTHEKLVVSRIFLSIGIVLSCFYLLIFYFEKFSTWIWRLPFAIYVKLNLSITSLTDESVGGRHNLFRLNTKNRKLVGWCSRGRNSACLIGYCSSISFVCLFKKFQENNIRKRKCSFAHLSRFLEVWWTVCYFCHIFFFYSIICRFILIIPCLLQRQNIEKRRPCYVFYRLDNLHEWACLYDTVCLCEIDVLFSKCKTSYHRRQTIYLGTNWIYLITVVIVYLL